MIEKVMGIYKGLIEYKKAFICGWVIFIATAVFTAIICSMLSMNIKSLINGLDNNFPSYHSQLSSFEGILLNNIKTCLQIFVLSLIPILFLPWISIIFNSALLGFIAYVVIALHQNIFKMFALGMLPHGIIEYSVYILCACIATRFQKLWIKKIKNLFRRKTNKKPLENLFVMLRQICGQFIFVLLPALVIAAFIEVYISKYLLDKFM